MCFHSTRLNNMMPKRRTLTIFLTLICILLTIFLLFKVLLPTPLQYADVYHLTRLYLDEQAIPVDSKFSKAIGGDNKMITIKVDEQIIKSHLQKTWVIPEKTKYEKDPVLKQFMPITSLKEQATTLIVLETFIRVCEEADLSYFFFSGSLLGVYRHHGFIPWDDDIDTVMNVSDWIKIRDELSRVQGYVLYTPSDSHWKFYKKGLRPVPGQDFLWPFIDIFFFTEDNTHVWALSDAIKLELVNLKDEIFPLQLRPFEHLQVRVPCKMEEIIHRLYGIKYCHSPIFLHKISLSVNSNVKQNILCTRLYNMFPFVFRQIDPSSGNIVETLKRGNKILKTISVPQSCKPER